MNKIYVDKFTPVVFNEPLRMCLSKNDDKEHPINALILIDGGNIIFYNDDLFDAEEIINLYKPKEN